VTKERRPHTSGVVRGEAPGEQLGADALQRGVVVGKVRLLGHPEAARQEGLRRVLEIDPDGSTTTTGRSS
jgi:hypothetical protein